MTFRDRIHPQLRGWYDASGGFDFDHLEEFVAKCNAAELDYTLDTPSAREITDTKVWCRDNCEKSWDKVLSPGKLPSPFESPALAKDLTGLPPLFSYIGQLDPGRDENIAYWTRLMDAGVACEYHVFPGCYHCFELSVPDADFSKVAYELTYAALKRAFGVEDGSTDSAE